MSTVTDTAPRTGAVRDQSRPAGQALAGTGTLFRFALRRDRVRLPAWVVAIVFLTLSSVKKATDMAPEDPEKAADMVKTLSGPAMLAMTGPEHYLSELTPASMLSLLMLGYGAILAGLMSVLTVVRHTRADEETGTAELVRSGVVGRHATLTAALATAATADAVLGLLLAGTLPGAGLHGATAGGALLYGAAITVIGLVFAGVAAVTVQLSAHARAASGAALAVLGAAYALRAAGDVGTGAVSVLSVLSPIGWIQRAYPFVDNRWWPLLPALALAVGTAAAGYVLSTRRDVGAGLLPPRTGRRGASAALTHPLGFAVRLHRGLVLGFSAALLVLGAMYGSILGDVDDMLKDLDDVREALAEAGGTLVESFASTVMLVVAVVASLFVVMAALRPRSEETSGRVEPLLATGLSRTRWAASHLVAALGGGTLVLLLGALGLGLAGAASVGDGDLFADLLGAGLAYAPALWVTGGVAVLLFGWAPRATALAWAVPAYGFAVGYVGKLLDLPGWLNDLSPFGHIPQLPATELRWTPLVLLTLVAAALIAGGLAGFRRRDLEAK
ncbi:ABC transporter permease [Streptomyces spirodelae]|uniref:ABC transporter permease n=1 Tax=Streptomyces spirodelae TaxID=2812904 RepID=A0ABS3X226_9ACTN|nr:ABC transporter permease [Streptomyces spirodelae]MBO8189433.1 ABC transporter permease [Streptomyces spirodelae]